MKRKLTAVRVKLANPPPNSSPYSDWKTLSVLATMTAVIITVIVFSQFVEITPAGEFKIVVRPIARIAPTPCVDWCMANMNLYFPGNPNPQKPTKYVCELWCDHYNDPTIPFPYNYTIPEPPFLPMPKTVPAPGAPLGD